MTIKEANDKFLQGKEGLTDEELCGLLSFYKSLCEDIKPLDSDFALFKKELNRRYELLWQFEFHRARE